MTLYRTRTYIAADFDHDKDAVDQLHKWNDSSYWSLSFTNAHDLQTSSDDSLYCSIKSSLKYRMDGAKTFILIVGEHTSTISKGGCQYCDSYNSYGHYCAKGHSIDYRSYIKYECDKAVEAGIKIIILYKGTRIDKSKCPEILRELGVHASMIDYKDGTCDWDYNSVKDALSS